MDILYTRCAGLDVHKKTIVACLLTPGSRGRPTRTVRTFSTMTADLLTLAGWLGAAGCTHVAMESTGVFWKPIFTLLEHSFTVLVVNAQHIKAVLGRKTDVRDAEWIAELLQHGLPRRQLCPGASPTGTAGVDQAHERPWDASERVRSTGCEMLLEGANIKLASVVSDVVGASARAMLEALIAGTTDGAVLADLAQGRMRKKLPELERALLGHFGPHQRFLVAQQLAHIDSEDATIERVSAEIAERLRPYEAELQRLQTIPGIGRRTAEIIGAVVGVDLARFPTAGHLASWAGLCASQSRECRQALHWKDSER